MKKSSKPNTDKPPFASGRKQSLGWMPDGETDPIIYLCRCLDHGASDAVEEDKPDPVTPLAKLTAKHHFAGKRLTWLFNAFCNQLDFESGNGSFGERNTDELLSAFCDFMQWRGVPYLDARHGDNVQIRDALQSICTSIKVETVKCAPMLDGSDGGEAQQLALAVSPDEFRARLTALLELDAATQQTAQAADGDEIARKVADAVGGQLKPMLKPIANDAHGAKVAAEAAEDRAEETKSLVKAHLTPRPADYQVTQDQLSGMLKARNCPKDKRTIIRWEKYLRGDLENGTKPPEGYTLQTRLTINSVKVWLDTYTRQDIGRMKVKVSYEAMTGGRS